jgi:hypothetical protein
MVRGGGLCNTSKGLAIQNRAVLRKIEGKWPCRRLRRRWKDDIKKGSYGNLMKDHGFIILAKDRDNYRNFRDTEVNVRIRQMSS